MVEVKHNMTDSENRYSLGAPKFEPTGTVSGNVKALRGALGSVSKPLSRDDLAEKVRDLHPAGRRLSGSTVARWEAEGDEYTEPDLWSTFIMARFASVSMEAFAAVGSHAAPESVSGTGHGRPIARKGSPAKRHPTPTVRREGGRGGR